MCKLLKTISTARVAVRRIFLIDSGAYFNCTNELVGCNFLIERVLVSVSPRVGICQQLGHIRSGKSSTVKIEGGEEGREGDTV